MKNSIYNTVYKCMKRVSDRKRSEGEKGDFLYLDLRPEGVGLILEYDIENQVVFFLNGKELYEFRVQGEQFFKKTDKLLPISEEIFCANLQGQVSLSGAISDDGLNILIKRKSKLNDTRGTV